MDIAPWVALAGAAVGVAGTISVQRFQQRRLDAGVRREMRTALRLLLDELDEMRKHEYKRLFIPRYKARTEAAIERFRRNETTLAYTDSGYFRVAKIVELLSDSLYTITSDKNDNAIHGYVENVALPSELDTICVYEPLLSLLSKARDSIVDELAY